MGADTPQAIANVRGMLAHYPAFALTVHDWTKTISLPLLKKADCVVVWSGDNSCVPASYNAVTVGSTMADYVAQGGRSIVCGQGTPLAGRWCNDTLSPLNDAFLDSGLGKLQYGAVGMAGAKISSFGSPLLEGVVVVHSKVSTQVGTTEMIGSPGDAITPTAPKRVTIAFPEPFQSVPNVIVTLSYIAANNKTNLRVKLATESVTKEKFELTITTWSGSSIWGTKVTWVASVSTLAQLATVTLGSSTASIKAGWQRTERVGLLRPLRISTVMVGLAGMDVQTGFDARLSASVSDISAGGFKIHADSRLDSITWKTDLAYVASCDRGIQSGTVHCTGLSREGGGMNRTYVSFPKTYTTLPAVVVSLCGVEMDHAHDMLAQAYILDVTVAGFMLHAGASDTHPYTHAISVSWLSVGLVVQGSVPDAGMPSPVCLAVERGTGVGKVINLNMYPVCLDIDGGDSEGSVERYAQCWNPCVLNGALLMANAINMVCGDGDSGADAVIEDGGVVGAMLSETSDEVGCHEHVLQFIPGPCAHNCDGPRCPNIEIGSDRFHCSRGCDYDLCKHCFTTHRKKLGPSVKPVVRVPLMYDRLQSTPVSLIRCRWTLLTTLAEGYFLPSIALLGSDSPLVVKMAALVPLPLKEAKFNALLKDTMKGGDGNYQITVNRFKTSRNKHGYIGNHGENSVFCQAMKGMAGAPSTAYFAPNRPWKTTFKGENVIDAGGGYNEAVSEMCSELSTFGVPVLIMTPNGRCDTGVNKDCLILNPNHIPGPDGMKMFTFLGTLMGIAMRTKAPLNLNLAPTVWCQLVGQPLNLGDLAEIDAQFVTNINHLTSLSPKSRASPEFIEALDIECTTPSASGKLKKILSDPFVTPENLDEYLRKVVSFRLHEFDEQVQAMRTGISMVVPIHYISLFTGEELKKMVSGEDDIDLALLRSVTRYEDGASATHPVIVWFWEVMEDFSPAQRSLVLRFAWGRTR